MSKRTRTALWWAVAFAAAVAARFNVAFTHMHVSKGAARLVAGIVPVAALGADSAFAAAYDGPGAAVFACR